VAVRRGCAAFLNFDGSAAQGSMNKLHVILGILASTLTITVAACQLAERLHR
jgi:hypothetical protein